MIKIFKDPREFVLQIIKEIDQDKWKVSDGLSFGPFLSSPDEKMTINKFHGVFVDWIQMQVHVDRNHFPQDIPLYYKEQTRLYDASLRALDRLRKGLRKQADLYIENLVEDFDETRI